MQQTPRTPMIECVSCRALIPFVGEALRCDSCDQQHRTVTTPAAPKTDFSKWKPEHYITLGCLIGVAATEDLYQKELAKTLSQNHALQLKTQALEQQIERLQNFKEAVADNLKRAR